MSDPRVSVIMPVRNEATFIERSIGSVLEQDYPAELMEILVVDGQSDDGTRDIVLAASAQTGQRSRIRIDLIDNPERIVSAALNRGIAAASGDVIVRVDGHCELAPDYVRHCVDALQRTGADNVGGLQCPVGSTMIGRAIAAGTSARFGVGGGSFHHAREPGWVDTVYLGAYRSDVFGRFGDFDPDLVRNQDDEFNLRLVQRGGKVWLDPSIRSVYHPRESLRALWRQYVGYGFYKVLVFIKRGRTASWRHIVPSAFVLGIASALVAGIVTRSLLIPVVVLGSYAVVSGIASIVSGRRQPEVIPILPVIFLTLHCAYGIGFLHGLWRWRPGRRP
jgi:glycosyltransferase involved in cell wall biosynthesis